MEKLNLVLEQIGNRNELHALLLNTFSLLEYIGSRKIIKSQIDREISEELLGHIAEEIRHAQLLKHLALKLSSGLLTSYRDEHLICGKESKLYFQTIDCAAEKALSKKNLHLNYLLTTLLIEERAAGVYPLYNDFLGRCGFLNKLNSIIRDEDKHLSTVKGQIEKSLEGIVLNITYLRTLEKIAFDSFMDAILQRLS